MVISFLIFLGAAIALERGLGNHGLWCAFCAWMVMRGITLAMRLPRIERLFGELAPVTN